MPGADPAVVWTIGGRVNGQGLFECWRAAWQSPASSNAPPELVLPVTTVGVRSKELLAEGLGSLASGCAPAGLPRARCGPRLGRLRPTCGL